MFFYTQPGQAGKNSHKGTKTQTKNLHFYAFETLNLGYYQS